MARRNHTEHHITLINDSGIKYLRTKLLSRAAQFACKWLALPTGQVMIILVTDAIIHQLNQRFLQHDYPTDILTFPLERTPLWAELYISVETARRNAHFYKVSLTNELLRLTFHGLLHIAGYDDHTSEQQQQMRQKEEALLSAFHHWQRNHKATNRKT